MEGVKKDAEGGDEHSKKLLAFIQEDQAQEERNQTQEEEYQALKELSDEVKESLRLLTLARKLHILVPSRDDEEIWNIDSSGNCILNKNGTAYFINEIKKVKNERADRALRWLAGIAAIIGTLTALAAVLMN